MPFDRLGGIGRHAAPGHQNARQPVLRDRAAAPRRDQEQLGGGGFVLGDAAAVELGDGVLDHGVDIAGDRGQPHQARGLGHVLRHAAAFLDHGGQRVLRFRVSGVGGLPEQFGGAREVLRELLALQVEQAEIVGGGRVTELGGGRQQAGGFVRVARSGAAFEVEHRQREHGVTVAVRGGELVPLRGLAVVAADAEALRVDFAEQRHGGGIILLRALGGLGERGQIIAALKGAIGEVEIAGVRFGRGRRNGWRRFFRRLRQCWRGQGSERTQRNDRAAPPRRHAALSGRRRCPAARAIVSTIACGSRHSQSPSATKSAPAFASGATSSSDAA